MTIPKYGESLPETLNRAMKHISELKNLSDQGRILQAFDVATRCLTDIVTKDASIPYRRRAQAALAEIKLLLTRVE